MIHSSLIDDECFECARLRRIDEALVAKQANIQKDLNIAHEIGDCTAIGRLSLDIRERAAQYNQTCLAIERHRRSAHKALLNLARSATQC
jgi:hypothetical protein